MARPKKYTDEQFAAAQQLIDNGESVSSALRQTGVPAQTWYARKRKERGQADPRPGGNRDTTKARAKPSVAAASITDEQLEAALTKIAIAPAVPASVWLRCEYCTLHFINQGPSAAHQLVEISKTNPALRKMLEDGYNYFNQGAWAALLAMYVGVPIAHHLVPDFIYKWCVLLMNMPERQATTSVPHAHTAAAASGNGGPPKPSGLESLDDEQLANMARAAGIDVTLPITDETTDADDTTDTDEPDSDAEPSTEDESVTSDTDTEQSAT